MSPETVTAAGMLALAIIDRAPDALRTWAADRRDKRKHQAAKGKDGAAT